MPRFSRSSPKLRLFVALMTFLPAALVGGSVTTSASAATSPGDWPMFGQNFLNTAAATEQAGSLIDTRNVGQLEPKWVFTTGGNVSARAAVVNGVAYFPDWAGNVYAVRASDGRKLWSRSIPADYLPGLTFSPSVKLVSRTTPYVDSTTNTMYLGTQAGAYMLAIDTVTGNLKWKTQLDTHPDAVDTGSPIAFKGVLYVGVSSMEELSAAAPNYPCCSFRGSVVALDASSGQQKWKTYTTPAGYSGVAVWGSTIVPDLARGVVYATTGNNYDEPTDPAYHACIEDGGTAESCGSPDNHFDSVLALNMKSGGVVWSQRLGGPDDWNLACPFHTDNCPEAAGEDFDFGSGVNMFTIKTPQGDKQVIGAGQKSGVYVTFDPDDHGKVLWATQVGPGSSFGGIIWGSATDGRRIYVAIGNFKHQPYTFPSGETSTGGSWAALDPATGDILWQTADPSGAMDLGPLTVSNGVVFAPSMADGATSPTMFALDGSSGAVKWRFASGGSVVAGASIARNTVFWGSGYNVPAGRSNNHFYAFTLAGR
jgi:polyvinyl alcohol dehydrogenase (cytochrome)